MSNLNQYPGEYQAKEMLGMMVLNQISSMPGIIDQIEFNRKYAFTLYYRLSFLDAQLKTFRDLMFLVDIATGEKIPYEEAIQDINARIRKNWENVYAKDYNEFIRACLDYSELIASAYPSLNLVPEGRTRVGPADLGEEEQATEAEDDTVEEGVPEAEAEADTIEGGSEDNNEPSGIPPVRPSRFRY